MGLREALKRQTTMVMGEQVPSTEKSLKFQRSMMKMRLWPTASTCAT
jgi:hypothetical protein